MKKLNKKAQEQTFLSNNALGIIIAVIGLTLLLYGAIKLYNLAQSDEDLSVKGIADSLELKFNALPNPIKTTTQIQGFRTEKEWAIWGWGRGDRDGPQKCFFSSCICICPDGECQRKGFCRDVNEEIVKIENHYREYERVRERDEFANALVYTGGTIPKNSTFISIPKNFIQIGIEKGTQDGKTFLKITHNETEIRGLLK